MFSRFAYFHHCVAITVPHPQQRSLPRKEGTCAAAVFISVSLMSLLSMQACTASLLPTHVFYLVNPGFRRKLGLNTFWEATSNTA